MKKVAFITAILGKYETTCKPFVNQTVESDFICFTDNPDMVKNGWELDTTPYHDIRISPVDDGLYVNSTHKNNLSGKLAGRLDSVSNRHTFNLAKYYKQQWKLVPRLQEYEVIIWLDGTLEIINPKTAEYMLELCPKYDIVTWQHELRGGFLFHEAFSSYLPKYHNVDFLDQRQPYQQIMGQYMEYVREGYDEDFFKNFPRKEGRGRGDHFGVWATGFVAFNNRSQKVKEFIDLWYLQTLKYSTQDQVGFPKVVQDTGLVPYTLPDEIMPGNESHVGNSIFKIHTHGS